jgi:hypothetical protein
MRAESLNKAIRKTYWTILNTNELNVFSGWFNSKRMREPYE